MSDVRECAINDCHEPSVGLMEWPDIHVFIELCQTHADYVGAVERVLNESLVSRDAADRINKAIG